MSRIGKQPITIPAKVKVDVKGSRVFVEGPNGKLDMEIPRRTSVKIEGGNALVNRDGDDAEAFHSESARFRRSDFETELPRENYGV